MLHSPGPILLNVGRAFNLPFDFELRWYGLLTGLGFFVATCYCNWLVSQNASEEEKQNLWDFMFACFFGGIIGARLWFCALNPEYYLSNPIKVLQIWEGGQSIQGGFLGGLAAALIFYRINSHKKLLPFGFVTDIIALALPIAQAIGRWGNFFNIEAFGKPSNLPWAQYVPQSLRPLPYASFKSFHPTFLYESLFLLLVAVLMKYLYDKKLLNTKESGSLKVSSRGSLICVYFAVYSIGRFFLEFVRSDSLMIGSFPAAQIICIVTIIASGLVFVRIQKAS